MNHTLLLTFTIGIGIAATVSTPLLPVVPRESTQGRAPEASICSPDRFPSSSPSPTSCCQDGNRTWHVTNNGKRLALRVYSTPCTEADGVSTNCGVGSSPMTPRCAHGPCQGARIVWAVDAEEALIFHPLSKPRKCGWEVNNVITCVVGCDWPEGVVREYPEPFLGQVEYPGVIPSCPYRRCLVGGIPSE